MPLPRPPLRAVLLWLMLALLGCVLLAGWRHAQLRADFDEAARTLFRVVAQRADQHDAHLTNLAAVAQLDDPGHASFLAVATAVRHYYPRIRAIQLLALEPAPQVLAASGGAALEPAALAPRVRALGTGKAGLLNMPLDGGYVLVKRLARTSLTALVLVIDGARLSESEGVVGPTGLRLDGPGGTIYERPASSSAWPPPLRFEQELTSASQPLRLVLTRQPGLAELLPPGAVLLILLGSAALLSLQAGLQRMRRARRAAALQAQELRLAHAMRVNGLGEMASGIAHELTQPLTALLSQSQAGLRMIDAGAAAAALAPVLQANVRLAKRAGAILERIRSYVSQREPQPQRTDLGELVGGVAELARADLQARGIALELVLEAAGASVLVDPISLEQVLHNLVRNAADALQDGPPDGRLIRLRTLRSGAQASVEVSDNGPGITPELLPRLFTPFFTTKPGGMGLGLSLCERLVEAMGGRIEVSSAPGQGARFSVHLRVATP